ncbi:hypothetical protein [Chitinophaga sp. YR573]|uniref:hypothetical protein n=1 Tax=Chitinophaga sp. YR573 TaxID=1881040 RepID=UPI00115FA39A|nr:hypothetical protein [Chitinophaga sp. YR573]
MKTIRLPIINVRHLDDFFLDNNGHLKAISALELHKIHEVERSAWAQMNSVYHFITKEMIEWLKEKIEGRSAVEICAGNGGIARLLGIPATDSYYETEPNGIDYCLKKGIRPVFPAADVIKMEANEAITYDKPKVAIGAFVPQIYLHSDVNSDNPGKTWGVDEVLLLKKVQTYIMLGNEIVDKGKRIFKLPHQTYRLPWQITRANEQALNRIWIWDKRIMKVR